MHKLIVTTITAIALVATSTGGVVLHGQSPAAAQRAMMLQNLSDHSRTMPLWIPG